MESNPLVSVITPAYNSGAYIGNLLDSILMQTYSNIEIFIIDDGSTDNTRTIVENYIPRFTERGVALNYFFQENSGQSVAINKALKLIRGKYLVWPDSDDYYNTEDCIERMVQEFEKHGDNVGIVRTQEKNIRKENDRIIEVGISGLNSKPYYKAREIFENCLYSNNFYFCAGAYMINVRLFKECNGLEIYTEKNAGQNWQILLPILYNYGCITILEPLYNVVERSDSHSRGQYKGFDAEIFKINSYRNTVLSTLDRMKMPDDERKFYKERIKEKYIYSSFLIAFRYSRRKEGIRFFRQMPRYMIDSKSLMMKYLLQLGISKIGLKLYRSFRRE